MEHEYTNLLGQISRLSSAELAQLLGSLAFELTIQARGTYAAGSSGVQTSTTLRAFNECEHFLLGMLRHLLFREEVDVESWCRVSRRSQTTALWGATSARR